MIIVAVALAALAVVLGLSTDGAGFFSAQTVTTPPLHALKPLGEGKQFGFVTALDPAKFVLVFDRAELLSGPAAVSAAAADGGTVTEGGSYVRNPDDRSNRVTIDPHVVIRLLVPCCELHEVSFKKWLSGFDPADDRTFYGTTHSHYELTITGGAVTAVDEVLVK